MLAFGKKTMFKEQAVATSRAKIKRNFLKNFCVGTMVLVCGLVSYDVGVTASNINHINNMAEYKIQNQKSLDNYSTFKDRVMAVPYSDAQFKKDLTTFEYMYGYKGSDSPVYKKIIEDEKTSLNVLLYQNLAKDNANNFYSDLYTMTKSYTLKDYTNRNSAGHKKFTDDVSKVQGKHEIAAIKYEDVFNMNQKERIANMASQTLGYYYSNINNKMYQNFRNLLVEKGFSANAYFPDKEKAGKYHDLYYDYLYNYEMSSEKLAIRQDFYDDVYKNNQTIRQYYEQGDFKKLRELFKIGNGFSQIAITDYINATKENSHLGEPFYYRLAQYFEMDPDIKKPAKVYEEYTGSTSPEKKSLYDRWAGAFFYMP